MRGEPELSGVFVMVLLFGGHVKRLANGNLIGKTSDISFTMISAMTRLLCLFVKPFAVPLLFRHHSTGLHHSLYIKVQAPREYRE